MSIIQDQQLIESLSDQDLARLIQGEIPQLAHLAPVGVSETTRRLDFRREYEEELARLDQPQENIATQLAQQLLLQQGVPTVNQGVTDEFPQGGIAGPQQATEETAATGTATPTATTAPATATPATAPVPAGGAGAIPGMQAGGLIALLKALAPAIGAAGAAIAPRAWQAGKGAISPIIKNITQGFKPAVRRTIGEQIPARGSRVFPKEWGRIPRVGSPRRKPWMDELKPGFASPEARGRMFLDRITPEKGGGLVSLLARAGAGAGAGYGLQWAMGDDEEAGAPTSVGGWNIGEVGNYTLPSGEEVQVQVVGFSEECPDGICFEPYNPEGSGKPREYQRGGLLGNQDQDLESLLLQLFGDRASQIHPLDIPELGTQERYSLEEMLKEQLQIPDLMSVEAPEPWGGVPMRLPDRLPERGPDLGSLDISGDPLTDLLSRPQQLSEIDLGIIDPSDVSRRSRPGLDIRSDVPPIDRDGLPQVRPAPIDQVGMRSTAEDVLSTLDEIMGARDYTGLAQEFMGSSLYPSGDLPSDVIRARMEEYETLSPEDQAVIDLEEELIGTRYDQRGDLIKVLADMAKRHEDPSRLETYLTGEAEMAPEFQRGDEIARSLAGVADTIAGNIFPGDLGKGLSSLVTESADRMQQNRILNENRYREIFTAEEDRERLHDELRSAAIQAEIGSEQEKDAARLRLAELRRELARMPEALEPSLMAALASERREDIDLVLRLMQQQGTDRAGILSILSGLVGGSRAASGDTRLEIATTIMGELRDEEAAIREGQQYWPDPKPSPGDSNYPQYQIYLQRLANLADLREQLIGLGIDPDQDQSIAGTNPVFTPEFR